MKRRTLLSTASALASAMIAGCTGGGGGGGDGGDGGGGGGDGAGGDGDGGGGGGGAGEKKTVVIQDKEECPCTFDPVWTDIGVGGTIEWVNEDDEVHEFTTGQFHADAKQWPEPMEVELQQGDSTSFTFEEEGVYEFYCAIHEKGRECGAIRVGGEDIGVLLPCEV